MRPRGTRAKVGWAFLGRLAFRPSPFGVPGRNIDRALLGRRAFGPSPFRALRLGLLVRGTEPGLMVPTMPPFSCRGGRSSSVGKKRNKLDRHIIGNSRPSMLHNFQCKFCNFYETVLDAIGSF